jgi:TonB family protein
VVLEAAAAPGALRRRRPRRRYRPVPPLRAPVLAPPATAFDRAPATVLVGAALLVSVLAHVALARALVRRGREAAAARSERIRVAVVERPAPPKPELAAPAPQAPAQTPPRRKLRSPAHILEELPPTPAPPPKEVPPTPEPVTPAATSGPPLLMPGAAISATSSTGTMAVRAGRGGGSGAPGPAGGGGGQGAPGVGEIAPAYALTEEPVFLDNVSTDELRKYYPEEARKNKVEGDARLKFLVDDQGHVAQATLVSDPTGQFGKAALKAAHLYRFKPAKISGRHVATWIEFTIHFELD